MLHPHKGPVPAKSFLLWGNSAYHCTVTLLQHAYFNTVLLDTYYYCTNTELLLPFIIRREKQEVSQSGSDISGTRYNFNRI